jgi:hypothetical protein
MEETQMRFSIPTQGMTFMAAGTPRAETKFESDQPQTDKEGRPIYSIEVVVLDGEGADKIRIKVPGQPDIVPSSEIKVTGLVANAYDKDRKKCVSFSAERIEPASKAAKAA